MHEIKQSGPDAIDKSLPLFPQNGPIFLGRSNYDEMNLEILNRVKQALKFLAWLRFFIFPHTLDFQNVCKLVLGIW